MARVKQPLLSSEASGTVGGLEFKRSSYGTVVSRRSIAPHIQTPAALAVRDNLHIAHAAWLALPDSARAAWRHLAPARITGRLSFISAFIQAKTLAMLLPDNPTPAHADVKLGPITVQYCPNPYPYIQFLFDPQGDLDCPVSLWIHQTWSHRATPRRTAYRFTYWDFAGVGSLFYLSPNNAPRVNYQLRIHDKLNGVCCHTTSGHFLLP